jgi:hypothetical protein
MRWTGCKIRKSLVAEVVVATSGFSIGIALVAAVVMLQSHVEGAGLSKRKNENFRTEFGIVDVPGYAGAARRSGGSSRSFRTVGDRHNGGRTIHIDDTLSEFATAAAVS